MKKRRTLNAQEEVIEAASQICFSIITSSLDHHIDVPNPLITIVTSYLKSKILSRHVTDCLIRAKDDVAFFLISHADLKLVWILLQSQCDSYQKNHYGGRGAFFLSLDPQLRLWIWQHRYQVDILKALAFGRRIRKKAFNWEVTQLEVEIKNRLHQQVQKGSYKANHK